MPLIGNPAGSDRRTALCRHVPRLRRHMRLIAIGAATAAAFVLALPAAAATPVFTGTDGPGFTISMAKKPTRQARSSWSSPTSSVAQLPSSRAQESTTKTRRASSRHVGYRHEDVHGDTEERQVQVRVRPARQLDEGLVQRQVGRASGGALEHGRPEPPPACPFALVERRPSRGCTAGGSGIGWIVPSRSATRRARRVRTV